MIPGTEKRNNERDTYLPEPKKPANKANLRLLCKTLCEENHRWSTCGGREPEKTNIVMIRNTDIISVRNKQ